MELKAFQRAALDTLTIYLQRARLTSNPEQAFLQTWSERTPDQPLPPYRTIDRTARRAQCLPAAAHRRWQDATGLTYCCRGWPLLP